MLSAILDVVLGMTLLYIILSILTSAGFEIISNLLNLRAAQMERFLRKRFFNSDVLFQQFLESTIIAPQTPNPNRPPVYIKATDFSDAVFDLLRESQIKADPLQPISFNTWRQATDQLKDEVPLKKVMVSVMDKAENDLNKARMYLANWFDNSMERVSGIYKKTAQTIIFVIALVVAVALNVDSITIANALLQNPALRESIAAQAGLTAGEISARATTFAQIKLDATAQVGANTVIATPQPGTATTSTIPSAIPGLYELQQLNVPLGWPDPTNDGSLNFWLRKLIGLLLTAFAASQGAPFWFDLLNKVTNVRSSGRPPEKAPEAPASGQAPPQK